MFRIKKKSLKEIKKRIKDFLLKTKSENKPILDLVLAENFAELGYNIAVNEVKRKKFEKLKRRKKKKDLSNKIKQERFLKELNLN